jgi:hypothetical protein
LTVADLINALVGNYFSCFNYGGTWYCNAIFDSSGDASVSSSVRRAITTEAATANDHITCNLYDANGVEITSGTGSGIEVYCSIINATALNAAAPRLENNDDLFVVSLPNSSSTVRWYCVSLFQKSEDCT